MGTTFTNFHVRTENPELVVTVLAELEKPAFVLQPTQGWVSVLPFQGSPAQWVSQRLMLPVLALSEYDSDAAQYHLFEKGELVDSYYSDTRLGTERGDPDKLAPYLLPEYSPERLRDALIQTDETADPFDSAFVADTAIEQLTTLLGLTYGSYGFETFYSEYSPQELSAFVGHAALSPDQLLHCLERTVQAIRIGPWRDNQQEVIPWIRNWLDWGSPPESARLFTPLMLAAARGSLGAVELLLVAGASGNRRDGLGKTALDYATSAEIRNRLR